MSDSLYHAEQCAQQLEQGLGQLVGTAAGPEAEPGSGFRKSITIPFFSHPIMQICETPIYRREANPNFPPVSTDFLFPDL